MVLPEVEKRISLGNVLTIIAGIFAVAAFYFTTELMHTRVNQRIELEQTRLLGEINLIRAETTAVRNLVDQRNQMLERAVFREFEIVKEALRDIRTNMNERISGVEEKIPRSHLQSFPPTTNGDLNGPLSGTQ